MQALLRAATARTSSISPAVTSVGHGLLIVIAAALLALPALLVGIPPGYDSDHHTAYQYHFSRQFWDGDLYPRWLADANKGHGSPIFIIQYPLPYIATALLRPLTGFPPGAHREARELGVLCFLALAAAGLAALVWFRKFCTSTAATLAAVAYISLPYILGQTLYRRTALGELCAFVWMPLALALCHSLKPTFLSVSALAVVLALLIGSHLTSAALFLPLLLCYAVVCRRDTQSSLFARVASIHLALTLAVGLAAVYLFPLLAYRHLFDMNRLQVIMPSFELGRWFAYTTLDTVARHFFAPAVAATICLVLIIGTYIWRVGGGRFLRVCMSITFGLGLATMIPELGPTLIRLSGLRVTSFETAGDFSARMLHTGLLTLALGLLAYCLVAKAASYRDGLLLMAACCAWLLMLPWSAPFWVALRHEAASIQFPFRLGVILTLAVAGLLAAALDACLRQRDGAAKGRLVVLGVLTVIVIVASSVIWRVPDRFRDPHTAELAVAQNVDVQFRSYVPSPQVAKFAAMLGTTIDSFAVPLTPAADNTTVSAKCYGGGAEVRRQGPRVLRVTAQCPDTEAVQIGQVYLPLWRVASVARSAQSLLLRSSPAGLIEVVAGAGSHELELVFDGGLPERAGILVTLASTVVVGAGSAVAMVGRMTRTLRTDRRRACHA